MSLCLLPRVIWQKIFGYLSTRYAKTICTVCKFFNNNFWENRHSLTINVNRSVTDSAIPYQFKKVRELIIVRRSDVNNVKLYTWIESWPTLNKIESLSINYIGPGDCSIIPVKMPQIIKIDMDITAIKNYARRYEWTFLTEDLLLQIKDFSLKGLNNVQQRKCLEHINRGLRNCERLCLIGIPLFVESSHILFNGLSNVISLELSGKNVTDDTFEIVAREMPNLRELIIPRRNNTNLTNLALSHIENLHNLRHLNISGFSKCTDIIADSIFNANPELQKVYMNGCCLITDLTIHCLSKYLPKIKEVSFRGCYLLTDDIFCSLALLPLRVMNFAICINISNQGIEQFCRAWSNGNDYLQIADFTNSEKVTEIGEAMIRNICPNLIQFNKSNNLF